MADNQETESGKLDHRSQLVNIIEQLGKSGIDVKNVDQLVLDARIPDAFRIQTMSTMLDALKQVGKPWTGEYDPKKVLEAYKQDCLVSSRVEGQKQETTFKIDEETERKRRELVEQIVRLGHSVLNIGGLTESEYSDGLGFVAEESSRLKFKYRPGDPIEPKVKFLLNTTRELRNWDTGGGIRYTLHDFIGKHGIAKAVIITSFYESNKEQIEEKVEEMKKEAEGKVKIDSLIKSIRRRGGRMSDLVEEGTDEGAFFLQYFTVTKQRKEPIVIQFILPATSRNAVSQQVESDPLFMPQLLAKYVSAKYPRNFVETFWKEDFASQFSTESPVSKKVYFVDRVGNADIPYPASLSEAMKNVISF